MNRLLEQAIPEIPQPDWQRVSQIPIVECGDGLQPMSLAPEPICTYPAYFKMGIPGAPAECHLRLGVYTRLIQAAQQLPSGIRLVVLDGWRPYPVQQHLYDTLVNLMEHSLPNLTTEQLHAKARDLVSPPSNEVDAPSPHLTGGSVDITLADRYGQLLDMGTRFDEASPLSFTASFEKQNDLTPAQQQARDNRRLLYNVMVQSGFTNLPSEWWHFDYGNQLWAWCSGNSHAIYGTTHPESLEAMWQQQLNKQAGKDGS
ncbi:D-alanyl-D-alanine dipeptidase [Motiliproteus coralliicola]|uniref:D-alanyl-D-alanine dipeptidase n=1 Tax=Motiliproteus coralliicola TaxID=2283196 RepID=A0A369WAV0_9GAMM|nr:M15 family metallopeptidase [Motiliproteus coralliicola]RDE18421.1 D-alanyl-D-alanine dipeptidase [Motiliproteus coralliicola]